MPIKILNWLCDTHDTNLNEIHELCSSMSNYDGTNPDARVEIFIGLEDEHGLIGEYGIAVVIFRAGRQATDEEIKKAFMEAYRESGGIAQGPPI